MTDSIAEKARKKIFSILITMLIAFNVSAAETIEDAWKAYGKKNYTEAINIFKTIALNGNDEAQFYLGMLYQEGQEIKQDYVEAIKWYKLAAAKEVGMAYLAQVKLGEMYAKGQGVNQDYVEAAKWYKLAAFNGNASARFNLADMYENGQGVKQDYSEAILWYKLVAAQTGPLAPIALYRLGLIYQKGLGVVQDFTIAHMWFNLSASKGYARAITNRDLVAEKMTPQQLSTSQKLARECEDKKYNGC